MQDFLPHSFFNYIYSFVGLCVALTLKHAQDCLQIVDRLDRLPSEADAQFMHDLADHRNWGYSVLFVNDTDEVVIIGICFTTCWK